MAVSRHGGIVAGQLLLLFLTFAQRSGGGVEGGLADVSGEPGEAALAEAITPSATEGSGGEIPLVEEAPLSGAEAPEMPEEGGGGAVSAEQGQTSIGQALKKDARTERRLDLRRDFLREIRFDAEFRTMYFDRNRYSGSVNQAWAAGGSVGLKSGFFGDVVALGLTGYTSQAVDAPEGKGGTQLLAPGQEGYSVLGELYADFHFGEDIRVKVGRFGFDTPYINRNDSRMTPNTFEALTVEGTVREAYEFFTLGYVLGYADRIKERNSDVFVPLSKDAGASVDRGVAFAGGICRLGDLTFGAVHYYSEDVIHITYAEAAYSVSLGEEKKLRAAAQFSDQRSTGDELLTGGEFSADHFGAKVDLSLGRTTLTTAWTSVSEGDDLTNPWSGFPGFTGVQVEDFKRGGEEAFLLRAAYNFSWPEGLSAYALRVDGTRPSGPGRSAREEYNLNVSWAPEEGPLRGLTLRARYAVASEDDGQRDDFEDLRLMCYYRLPL